VNDAMLCVSLVSSESKGNGDRVGPEPLPYDLVMDSFTYFPF
jgi:hypothetical protein